MIRKAVILPIFGDDWNTPDVTYMRDYLYVTDLAKGNVDTLHVLDGGMQFIALNLGLGLGNRCMRLFLPTKKFLGS